MKLLLWREAAHWVERIVAGDLIYFSCEFSSETLLCMYIYTFTCRCCTCTHMYINVNNHAHTPVVLNQVHMCKCYHSVHMYMYNHFSTHVQCMWTFNWMSRSDLTYIYKCTCTARKYCVCKSVSFTNCALLILQLSCLDSSGRRA